MNLFPKIKPFLHGVAQDFWPKRSWERVLLVISILFCLLTILAAYGGAVRPGHGFFREMLPGLVMAFPLLLYVLIVALGVSLFMWRRGARVLFVTFLAILPAAYIITPPSLRQLHSRQGCTREVVHAPILQRYGDARL